MTLKEFGETKCFIVPRKRNFCRPMIHVDHQSIELEFSERDCPLFRNVLTVRWPPTKTTMLIPKFLELLHVQTIIAFCGELYKACYFPSPQQTVSFTQQLSVLETVHCM